MILKWFVNRHQVLKIYRDMHPVPKFFADQKVIAPQKPHFRNKMLPSFTTLICRGYYSTRSITRGYDSTSSITRGYDSTRSTSRCYDSSRFITRGYHSTRSTTRSYGILDMILRILYWKHFLGFWEKTSVHRRARRYYLSRQVHSAGCFLGALQKGGRAVCRNTNSDNHCLKWCHLLFLEWHRRGEGGLRNVIFCMAPYVFGQF